MPAPDLDLSPARRGRVADELRSSLERAIAGSSFALRGSIAEGRADRYSDIDAVWRVPGTLQSGFDALPNAAAVVGDVFSVRVAPPELADADCLVFVTFADLPIFWRLDLVIESTAPVGELTLQLAPPWSLPESALANAVAAVKAVVRGRNDDAAGLLERGYPRVGARYVASGSWRTDVERLAAAVGRADAALEPRAELVRSVAAALLAG